MKITNITRCYTREDDIANRGFWLVNVKFNAVYLLYVIEARSVDYISKELGLDIYSVIAIIDGVRAQYDMTLLRLCNRIIRYWFNEVKIALCLPFLGK